MSLSQRLTGTHAVLLKRTQPFWSPGWTQQRQHINYGCSAARRHRMACPNLHVLAGLLYQMPGTWCGQLAKPHRVPHVGAPVAEAA